MLHLPKMIIQDSLTFLEKNKLEGKAVVLGIPLDLGKEQGGTAGAPDYLRDMGLIKTLGGLGIYIKDLRDLRCPSHREASTGDKKVKYLKSIARVAEKSAKQVSEYLQKGYKCIALGGDHSVSIGTIAGASAAFKKDLGVIWIDAHGDINTPETTPTGHLHGQASAVALGWGHPDLVNLHAKGPKIKKENIFFIGLKDLDQSEVDTFRRHKINFLTNQDILKGRFDILEQKLRELNKRVKNIWVSFDIDVVGKGFAPASIMTDYSGLNYREINSIAKYIGRTRKVVGMDVVELAPKHDIGGATAKLILELIPAFLGSEYSDYSRYLENYSLKTKR